MQVRIKGIITGLCAEVPPTTILQILTGFYNDGIYYPPHFLFASEVAHLDFNYLGATRAMIRPLLPQDSPTDPRYLRDVKGMWPEMLHMSFDACPQAHASCMLYRANDRVGGASGY